MMHQYRGWRGTKASGAAGMFLISTYMAIFGVIDQDAWVWVSGIAAGLLGGGDVGSRFAARKDE